MVAAGKQSTNGSRPKTVRLDKIRLDGDTQSRVELDEDVVKEYADLMKDGVEFPPLGVTFDGSDYWLYDGFHRRHAAVKANLKEFRVIAINGTREDARWFSYSANITHGLKRTNEDKEKAVKAALKHPKGAKLSNTKIAEHVGVTDKTVAKYRAQLETSSEIPKIESRSVSRGDTTYEQSTTNIGKSKPAATTILMQPEEPPLVQAVREFFDECLNCPRGGNHERGEDGTCTKCKDPPAEPPAAVDNDFTRNVAKGEAAQEVADARSKTVKTAEALMRAFDDLNQLVSHPKEHASAIATCKILLKTARDWK